MNLPDFSKAAILVIGDAMLDQYYFGNVSRISPEAPVPVIHAQDCRYVPGGAANVAYNIANLGARVFLVGRKGNDQNGKELSALLKKCGIDAQLFISPGPTVTKMRIVGSHQQI